MTRSPETETQEISHTVCVFVASSDNTRDIFSQVSRCYGKYWPDCPFPRYVGLNSPISEMPDGFRAVHVPALQWQNELSRQISGLPRHIRHILLFLDDFFILSKVNTARVEALVERAVKDKLGYLRLIPQSRALFPLLFKKLRYRYRPAVYEKIGNRTPYHSSLQVALWEREHLGEMLNAAENVWAFENTRLTGTKHYAIVENPPIEYVHVVEKGQWEPYTASLFKGAGLAFDPSERRVLPPWYRMTLRANKVKFAVFGYSIFRLRRWIRSRKQQGERTG